MVDSIALSVPDEDLAESLKDCKVGEEKTVTFKVTGASPGNLSGDVTGVEGYGQEEEQDYDSEEEMAEPDHEMSSSKAMSGEMGKMKKRMPKAIVMIGMGK